MRIQFTRRTQIKGKTVRCDSHLDCGNTIKNGEAHWRSGSIDGNNRYGICQKCFGFWLARYYDFDYVGELDAKDLYWRTHWENEWDTHAIEEWYKAYDFSGDCWRVGINGALVIMSV